jgi:hypothetical protein
MKAKSIKAHLQGSRDGDDLLDARSKTFAIVRPVEKISGVHVLQTAVTTPDSEIMFTNWRFCAEDSNGNCSGRNWSSEWKPRNDESESQQRKKRNGKIGQGVNK